MGIVEEQTHQSISPVWVSLLVISKPPPPIPKPLPPSSNSATEPEPMLASNPEQAESVQVSEPVLTFVQVGILVELEWLEWLIDLDETEPVPTFVPVFEPPPLLVPSSCLYVPVVPSSFQALSSALVSPNLKSPLLPLALPSSKFPSLRIVPPSFPPLPKPSSSSASPRLSPFSPLTPPVVLLCCSDSPWISNLQLRILYEDPLASPQASEPWTSPRTSDPPDPPWSCTPSAPPWTVIALALLWTCGSPAVPRSTTPLAPPGSFRFCHHPQSHRLYSGPSIDDPIAVSSMPYKRHSL